MPYNGFKLNMGRKLIVHADDYGFTPSVSRGVLKAHRSGIVTSTSILSNKVTEDELNELRAAQSLDFGVHLTLTTGRSVLPRDEVGRLVDENGYFYKRGTSQRPLKKDGFIDFSTFEESEILVEFEAQLFRIMNFGLKPTHFDTHHHIHSDSKVLAAVMHLAREHGMGVRSITESMRDELRSMKITTNDYFESGFFGQKAITPVNLKSILKNLKTGVTELMCHPGEVSDELLETSGYTVERELEMQVLTDKGMEKEISREGITLIGWRDVVL